MKRTACLAALLLSVSPVAAGDVALIVGNGVYANGDDLTSAARMLDAVTPLEEAGFTVLGGSNLGMDALRGMVSELNVEADGTGRVVIGLSGHFAKSEAGSWFLATDADAPDLGSVGAGAVSLEVLLEIAARAPGGAVVLLGSEQTEFGFGAGLTSGLAGLNIPQGVTVIRGPSGDVADFGKDALTVAGQSLATALADRPSLSGEGFMAPLVAFLPQTDGLVAAPAPVDPDAAQKALWRATEGIGSKEAFNNYLRQYPKGLFAQDAADAIAAIDAAPALRAEADEAALGLSRDRRREIQRALTLLDYDPRGIDGVFGRGSRAAIAKWQNVNGETATGFLTGPQIDRIAAQAERRSAELEEQARLRQIEQEREDRAYWRATGQQGDEAGLRAYLERYPDGAFADIAAARLEPFEAARRATAAEQDRADWDAAVSTGSLAAYEGYVQANPEGAFVDEARVRIAELSAAAQNADALAAAARNEERLGLNDSTRRLIEDRLAKLGLEPGQVDGAFDNNTRRAIRRYQEARELPRTGFLSQQTLVRLLADSVLR